MELPQQRRQKAAVSVSIPELKRSLSPALPDRETSVSPDERRLMICEAAYYHAQQRGFAPGHEVEDWLAAEQEVERILPSVPSPAVGAFR